MTTRGSRSIVVLGYIVRGPIGGMAWSDLHYLIGLKDLGHEVYFVEDSDDYPSCYDPAQNCMTVDPAYGLDFAARAFEHVGFGDRWGYFDAHTSRWFGPLEGRIEAVSRRADILLNLGGVNPVRSPFRDVPVRVFVDKDPVFTQIRHLLDPAARDRASAHTAFFSFGENIGRQSAVPDDGLPWQPTRHPIALRHWPVVSGETTASFTTVMQWESYPSVEYGGRRYGTKSQALAPYVDLPRQSGRQFELAIGTTSAPRAMLIEHGWRLADPVKSRWDPADYQRYIQNSRAEFTIAKHGYVTARSGWFSERSASYLASGRPVVTEETGFSDWLHREGGVLSFSTPQEAIAAVEDVERRYEFHARAARQLACEYFDSSKVLSRLIDAL